MSNEVSVASSDKGFIEIEEGIRNAALFFLGTIGEDSVHIDVNLVDEGKMRLLNQEHLEKNSPTNVLAFGIPKDFPRTGNKYKALGEIYLCPPYIKDHGEDINYMLLHGILHLLGFNHENKSDRIRMEKVEEELVKEWRSHKS